jgi:uncharacterized alpha-E superfamily protein
MLAIADASMAYRRRHRAAAYPAAVLELLLDDESNPRSVLHQLLGLEALLGGLGTRAAADAAALRLVTEARDELRRGALAGGVARREAGAEMDALLSGLARRFAALSEQIARAYFDRPQAPHQLVSLKA